LSDGRASLAQPQPQPEDDSNWRDEWCGTESQEAQWAAESRAAAAERAAAAQAREREAELARIRKYGGEYGAEDFLCGVESSLGNKPEKPFRFSFTSSDRLAIEAAELWLARVDGTPRPLSPVPRPPLFTRWAEEVAEGYDTTHDAAEAALEAARAATSWSAFVILRDQTEEARRAFWPYLYRLNKINDLVMRMHALEAQFWPPQTGLQDAEWRRGAAAREDADASQERVQEAFGTPLEEGVRRSPRFAATGDVDTPVEAPVEAPLAKKPRVQGGGASTGVAAGVKAGVATRHPLLIELSGLHTAAMMALKAAGEVNPKKGTKKGSAARVAAEEAYATNWGAAQARFVATTGALRAFSKAKTDAQREAAVARVRDK